MYVCVNKANQRVRLFRKNLQIVLSESLLHCLQKYRTTSTGILYHSMVHHV